MFTAGLLRLASLFSLLLMSVAIFLAFFQEQATGFWFIIAALFLGFAIYMRLKAKEKSIQAKVQIEEKERARIRGKQS